MLNGISSIDTIFIRLLNIVDVYNEQVVAGNDSLLFRISCTAVNKLFTSKMPQLKRTVCVGFGAV